MRSVRRISALVIGVGWLLAGTALAHHSISVHFDENERVTVTGTLTKLDWRNPHIEFAVEATDAEGQPQTWRVESFPPNWFVRHQISKPISSTPSARP